MNKLSDCITFETRQFIMSRARWNDASPLDLIRKRIKGTEYTEELMEIRMMSKYELIRYRKKVNTNKAVIAARKIKDNYWYRKNVDNSIKAKIELISYAYNRLHTLK